MSIDRTKLARILAGLTAVVLAAHAVPAQSKGKGAPKEEAPPAEQIDENEVLGEAYIATKVEFVKFELDGKKEWDNHDYQDSRKTLLIKGIARNEDHTVVLTPREPGFEAVTLTLKTGDFKRSVVKTKGRTQTITFKAHYRVDFKKVEAPKADKASDQPAGK